MRDELKRRPPEEIAKRKADKKKQSQKGMGVGAPPPLTLEEQLRAAILEANEQGLTQYELAKRAGIVPGVIYRFMSGERGMSFAALASLWEVLGLQVAKRA